MSTLNPASNFPNLAVLLVTFLSTTQNSINTFLNATNSTNYNAMLTDLNAAQASIATGANSTFRSLGCTSDGTVFYDSSKGADNTYANFLAKVINENHQPRPEILLAVLGQTSVGESDRYSTSVATTQKYRAFRLGDSTNNNLGTIRVSMDDFISV
jgi:hypothetical protein